MNTFPTASSSNAILELNSNARIDDAVDNERRLVTSVTKAARDAETQQMQLRDMEQNAYRVYIDLIEKQNKERMEVHTMAFILLLFPSQHLFPSNAPLSDILGEECSSALQVFSFVRRHVLISYIPSLKCLHKVHFQGIGALK